MRSFLTEDGIMFNHKHNFQTLRREFKNHLKLIRFHLADKLNAIITWYPQITITGL